MSASDFGPRPRERLTALAAVVAVQGVLAIVLLSGLRVTLQHRLPDVQRLISVSLVPDPKPDPPEVIAVKPVRPSAKPVASPAAPAAKPIKAETAPSLPAVTLVISLPAAPAAAAPAGTGAGGAAGRGIGSGSGGGPGAQGSGTGSGAGSDLVHLSGAIFAADYPAHLRRAGKGGRVGILFNVAPTGRVDRCSVTSSSGVPELDRLTCRLIRDRFVYRPSKDASGRPISEEVEGEHQWVMLKD